MGAAIIQSAGTLFFNVTTYQALHTSVKSRSGASTRGTALRGASRVLLGLGAILDGFVVLLRTGGTVPRSNANLRQEERVSDSDRSGVLFRRRDDPPARGELACRGRGVLPRHRSGATAGRGAPTVAELAARR